MYVYFTDSHLHINYISGLNWVPAQSEEVEWERNVKNCVYPSQDSTIVGVVYIATSTLHQQKVSIISV